MAEENGQEHKGGSSARTPPYVAYRTFLTLLEELQTNGIPPQIDRSVLSRFAGGVQSQLMLALKSLGLMADGNRPTQRLIDLARAYQTDQFKQRLNELLRATYPYVFELDLMTATPAMFAGKFSENTDAKEDVLRKCRTFFLHAAKDAGVPLGTRIENAKFPRSRSNGQKKPKPPKPKQEENNGGGGEGGGTGEEQTITDKALEYKLIDLMKESGVGDEERDAIWVLVKYLTAKAKAGVK